MATLLTLKTDILDMLDDPNNERFSASWLIRQINNAINQINLRTEYYKAVTNFFTSAGTSYKTIDKALILRILRVQYDGTKIEPVTKNLLDFITSDQTQQSTPDYYYVYGPNIYFYPVPDAVKEVQVDFLINIGTLSGDGDECAFPDFCNKAITMWVCHMAYLKEHEWSSSREFKALFDDEIKEILKTISQSPSLTMPPLSSSLIQGHSFNPQLPSNYPAI